MSSLTCKVPPPNTSNCCLHLLLIHHKGEDCTHCLLTEFGIKNCPLQWAPQSILSCSSIKYQMYWKTMRGSRTHYYKVDEWNWLYTANTVMHFLQLNISHTPTVHSMQNTGFISALLIIRDEYMRVAYEYIHWIRTGGSPVEMLK